MTVPSSLVLHLATEADRPVLQRMYAEQLRILHEFDDRVAPDRELEDDWWRKPGELFPYLIHLDGEPLGSCLVMGAKYAAAVGSDGDYVIWEMFVDAAHRGTGVAERALRELLAKHPGRWSVDAMPRNARAMGFWRRVLLAPPYGGVETRSEAGFAVFRFVAP